MDVPTILMCVGSAVLIGVAFSFVPDRARAKERAELVERAEKSEAELREWWRTAKTVTVNVGGERIVFTREPRGLSEQAVRDLLDWEDKHGGPFGVDEPSEHQ